MHEAKCEAHSSLALHLGLKGTGKLDAFCNDNVGCELVFELRKGSNLKYCSTGTMGNGDGDREMRESECRQSDGIEYFAACINTNSIHQKISGQSEYQHDPNVHINYGQVAQTETINQRRPSEGEYHQPEYQHHFPEERDYPQHNYGNLQTERELKSATAEINHHQTIPNANIQQQFLDEREYQQLSSGGGWQKVGGRERDYQKKMGTEMCYDQVRTPPPLHRIVTSFGESYSTHLAGWHSPYSAPTSSSQFDSTAMWGVSDSPEVAVPVQNDHSRLEMHDNIASDLGASRNVSEVWGWL